MCITYSTKRSIKRSIKRARVILLILPILALSLGACTKTTYNTVSNKVKVALAGGISCSDIAKLATCTSNGMYWTVSSVTMTDGAGRQSSVGQNDPALRNAAPCMMSSPCASSEIVNTQIPWTASVRPCGIITTKVAYYKSANRYADAPAISTETSKTSSGRAC